MTGFGVWLWQTRNSATEVTVLRKVATELGPDWPIASANRADYEVSINRFRKDSDRADALQALEQLWQQYESENPLVSPQKSPTVAGRLLDYLAQIHVWGIALGGLLIILLFVWSFNADFLKTISEIEAARGLITFLFALSTVGIAVIVVLATFLGSGTTEELSDRFQRGKDVLTILIGVFGAILGFYFGSEGQGQQPPTEVSSTAEGEAVGPPGPAIEEEQTTE